MSNGVASRGMRTAFALGLVTGAVIAGGAFAWYGRSTSATAAAIPQWHRGVSPGDLESAVRVSTRLLSSPASSGNDASFARDNLEDESASTQLARAEAHRRKREFREACELYASVAAAGAMTADAWADYADAQASLASRIAGEPSRAIEAALAIDPRHTKALWLQASLAHEEGRYADAFATWQRLLTLVPAGTSDARIVEANMAEAKRLAAG